MENNNNNNDTEKNDYKKTKNYKKIKNCFIVNLGIAIIGYIMALCFLYSL